MQRLPFIALLAWCAPGAILTQFLLAGLSLFHDTRLWAAHAVLGSALALPIGGVAFKAFVSSDAPHLRGWALVQVGIYVAQVVLIIVGQDTGSGVLQALHAFNGGLLLLVSFVIAQKVGPTSRAAVAPH
jgi:NAD/NADP transhydrogenase beta subunit